MKKLFLLAALLVFLAPGVQAQVAVSEPVVEFTGSQNQTTYPFGSFTPTANATLVIIAAATGTVDDGNITNTSGTALTWTRIGSRNYNTVDTIYAWWARTPGSTAASVYTVDFTGDPATGCNAVIFQITGADQTTSNPVRQFIFNNATSTNATTGTLGSATLTGSALVAGWGGTLAANSSTPPTSWTEIADVGYSTPTANGSGAYRAGGGTATSYSFTNASTPWGLAFVEIYASGAGPVGGLRRSVTWN
jgi:hypothetical protein